MANKINPNGNHCEKFTKKNVKIVVYIVIGCIFFSLATVSFLVDPIHLMTRFLTRISMGTILYNLLKQEDMTGAHVYTYVFNITNAEDFIAGRDSKLKVEEVGPFVYQEYRTNTNFELHEETGTMSYTPKVYARFIPELSIAHPSSVNLTMPNIAMLTITSLASSYPYWTRLAYNLMVKQLRTTSVMKVDAERFLWGYDEPLIAMAHNILPGWIDFERMGVLDRLYNSGDMTFELGATNNDKFRIKSYNGGKGIDALGYSNKQSRCNTFEDTYEGIAYPSDLTKERPLRVFRNVFCRILDLEYQGTKTMNFGPEVFRYSFSKKVFSNTTENKCLCPDNNCVDGITDLSPCFFGLSVALSNAHYLHGDPKIYERIEGIAPDEAKHGSEFLVDPKLGAVLDTRFTLQLSLVLKDISFNPIAKPFSKMIIPVTYFKIVQPELPQETVTNFWIIYILAPYIMHTIEIILFATGIVLITLSARLYHSSVFEQNNMNRNISQSEPLVDQKYNPLRRSCEKIQCLDSR
ncbi:scavenger receptor class B member 1-like isoform X1 [Colias croceus]|uniref:scavenger receptor class B member 1-like isoform X1 n=1 Tax=Colias crocea TaxID=72248 RepID=UPI001E27C2F9|nr:scavenger receptor class B member 1-like isoform X1 [Colias croceus]